MFSKILNDLLELLVTEIEEDAKIFKEILKYHGGSLIQSFYSSRQQRNIIKKMKKTTNYKQWKSLALSFDKIPGFQFYF
jgi:hypothetical protein